MAVKAAEGFWRPPAETVEVLGVRAHVARTFRERARGLIGCRSLPPRTGLLIVRCNAIHTFFMSMPIDAIFLDAEGRPVKTVRSIPPWRPWIWGGWRARSVLEIPAMG